MSTPENINKNHLRRLYRDDAVARAIFNHLAARKNNWREMGVDRLIQNIESEGTKVARADVTRILRELEHAGCGVYKMGRRGHPSRFIWDVEMVSVGKLAAGEAAVIDRVYSDITEEAADSENDGANDDAGTDELLTHGFQLRPDLLLSLRLPKNLTAVEAGRLSDYVKTLPFEN